MAETTPFDPLPPRTAAALRLAMTQGVGPRIRMALIEAFGSAEAVFEATPEQLARVPHVGPKLAQAIAAAKTAVDVEATTEECRRHGVHLVLDDEDEYPRALQEIADPPGLLFVRGTLEAGDALAVGIVGSRHATHYGLKHAEHLARGLARAGLTIVSGMARGIDAAAHRGALAAGGRTIAVLASGVVRIYPPEHGQLADEVSRQGALISEAPPNAVPKGGAFPQRNRIISGISAGVIVIEAGTRSGALITARHAGEQGRDVFALPGSIDNRMARGCHRLIRDGATLIETADDVLEQLGPLVAPAPMPGREPIHHPAELLLTEPQKRVLAAIGPSPTLVEDIVAQSGLPAQNVLVAISVLEMRRLIRRTSGQHVCRVC